MVAKLRAIDGLRFLISMGESKFSVKLIRGTQNVQDFKVHPTLPDLDKSTFNVALSLGTATLQATAHWTCR